MWFNNFDDDDDLEGSYMLSDAGKKCTIFVIDASPKMFEKYEGESGDDNRSSDCAFRRALKIIRVQLVNRAVTSSNGEYTAIIFINTAKSWNNVDNVVTWQELGVISAERVKQIDNLIKSGYFFGYIFRKMFLVILFVENIKPECDSVLQKTSHRHFTKLVEVMENVIIVMFFSCASNWSNLKNAITFSPVFQRRVVYLFTNEPNPFGSSKQHTIGAIKNADDLRKHNTEFAIFPILSERDEFAFDFNVWKHLDADVEKHSDNIVELEEDIARKQYARRNISTMDFSLSDDVKISVGIYSLIRSEKMPSSDTLDAERNEKVQRSFIYTNKQNHEEMPLFEHEITRRQQVGGAEVNMSADEIEKLRRLTPPGLVLLGFKPVSALKLSHHIRCSQYVYPLESLTVGSARLLRTLLEVCEAKKKIMICRYTQKENTPPKLVALVPQSAASHDQSDHSKLLTISFDSLMLEPVSMFEVRSNITFDKCHQLYIIICIISSYDCHSVTNSFQSKDSDKFRYPGFHLVYLPFFEDKRDLSEQMSHPDGEWPKGSFLVSHAV
ncbi:unnamed protein product [Anisakis simplex]|uniref:ATP-dependent DNA helicase 2 subunit 1 (inferred by orthology to a D. melanogaster protein) n=1 Tax=Anisakis simplex TaxID=6269 RepID=A0A0M3K237_ANISI|nr:unnamed protein product [Anisakis simplex]